LSYARRKWFSVGMKVLCGLAVVIVLVPLAAVLYEALTLGGPVLSIQFLTAPPPLPCSPHDGVSCPTGGIGPAIEGTLILIALASCIAVPLGLLAAIFAVEYRDRFRAARLVGLVADVLSGVPSIVVGVFVYSLILYDDPTIVFSTLSGSLALAVLMTPIVVRTSEAALLTVPRSLREASWALGISRWRTSLSVVLVSALPGILTGVLLAISRAAGEAAPLLLTDGGSFRGFEGLTNQVAALPILIFEFADSPYQNWIRDAWGAALVLILIVLVLSVVSRIVLDRTARRLRGE
jgi:phosphate transport system permease protein